MYKRSESSSSQFKNTVWTHFENKLPFTVKFDLGENASESRLKTLSENDTVLILSGITEPSEVFHREDFARKINVEATQRFFNFALERGAKLLYFSSVEVFDGSNTPISENTQTNSLNSYGNMKELNEKFIIRNFSPGRFSIIRTPWIVNPIPGSRCVITQTARGILVGNMRFAEDYLISLVSAEQVWQNLQTLLTGQCTPLPPTVHFVSRGFVSRYELACLVGKKLLNDGYPIIQGRFEDLSLSEPRSKDTRMISNLTWKSPFTKPEQIQSVIDEQIEVLRKRSEIVD